MKLHQGFALAPIYVRGHSNIFTCDQDAEKLYRNVCYTGYLHYYAALLAKHTCTISSTKLSKGKPIRLVQLRLLPCRGEQACESQ